MTPSDLPSVASWAKEDLRSWRTRLGLTQARAAALLGVHVVTLCRWECGHAKPPAMIGLACRAIADGFAGGACTAPAQPIER